MELALLRLGELAGIDRKDLLAAWPEQYEIAFDTETKMMATAHERDGRLFVAVKGAPEAVLETAISIGGKAGAVLTKRSARSGCTVLQRSPRKACASLRSGEDSAIGSIPNL